MKRIRVGLFLLALILGWVTNRADAVPKPRVFVLTDIENEPDDAMSVASSQ